MQARGRQKAPGSRFSPTKSAPRRRVVAAGEEEDEAEDEAEDEDADEAEDEDASEDPYEWPPKGDVAECNWQVLYLDEAENAWVAGLTVSEDAATGAVRVKPVDSSSDAEDLVFVSGDAKLRFMAPVD